jgi:hypothetical protein
VRRRYRKEANSPTLRVAVESNGAILVGAANGVIRIGRLTGRQTTLSSSGMFARPRAITGAIAETPLSPAPVIRPTRLSTLCGSLVGTL